MRRSTADAEADNGGQNNGDLVYSMEDWKFQKVDTVPWAVILMIANGLVIVTGCDLDLLEYCFMVYASYLMGFISSYSPQCSSCQYCACPTTPTPTGRPRTCAP